MPSSRTLAATLILLLSSLAFAGHPAATDDAGTVEPGSAEIELSSTRVETPRDPVSGYTLALRTGLSPRIDAGLAVETFVDGGAEFGFAFDTKWRLNEGRGWIPAGFTRADASVDAERDATWDGLAFGSTWAASSREVTVEWTGLGTQDALECVGLGIVWYESITDAWTLALEASAGPFAAGDEPRCALVGVIRDTGPVGAVSLGVRIVEESSDHRVTEVTVGLTR